MALHRGGSAGDARQSIGQPRGWRRLGALLLAACVTLPTVTMALGAWTAWRAAWDDAVIETRHASEAVAEYSRRVLGEHAMALGRMEGALRGLSPAEIRARGPALIAEWASLADQTLAAEAAYLLDGQGSLLLVAPDGAAAPAALASQGAQATNAGGLQVGAVRPHPGGGMAFTLGMARMAGGATPDADPGTIWLVVRPDAVASRLRYLLAGESDIAALLRLDGEVLARTVMFQRPIRLDVAGLPLAGEPDRALFESTSPYDGVRRLVAAHRVAGWPVYAVVSRPRAAIVQEWRAAVGGQLAVGVPATLALLVLTFAVLRGQRRLLDVNADLEARVAARTVELAEKEALLTGALVAGRVFAFEHDVAADTVIRSPNAAEILGLPLAQAVRASASAFLPHVLAEDRAKVLAVLDTVRPECPRWSVRFRYRRPDGRIIWLQDKGVGQFAADGRLLRLTSLSRDVTAEVAADAAMKEAGMRMRAAAEGAGIGTYEIDLAQGIAWFDARASQVLGGLLPPEVWIRLDGPEWAAMEAAIHPEDRAPFELAWADVVAGRAPGWSIETRLQRPDGQWIWDWCHGIAMDADPATGRPARVVGITRDVTERREMEAELRQGQKMQAIGQLAGGIAHDINNVLQAISGSALLAARDAADPEAVRRRLRIVSEAVARGASVTQRLLAFSRRADLRAEPIAPRALLAELAEMLRPAFGPAITLRIEAAEGLPALLADHDQLETALINLATNARDAMPQGGELVLAATAEEVGAADAAARAAGLSPGAYIRLSVRDSGAGMDAKTLAGAAEPFFTTKPKGKGTGLGLPLVKGLAERSGGGFAIESAPGRGTTVTLWLPRAAVPASAPAVAPEPCCGVCAGGILLVDDDELVRETLVEQFEAEGFRVTAARDAVQALAVLDAGAQVDALVTDLTMPGLDGIALISEVRRRRPGLPAVLVTGLTEDAAASRLGAAEPCTVLRKPVGGGEIAARVTQLVHGAAG